MKYLILFIVLASITSCIVHDPTKYKTVTVTLIEIRVEHRLIEKEWVKQIWYIYQTEQGDCHSLLIPLDMNESIGSVHAMYLRQ